MLTAYLPLVSLLPAPTVQGLADARLPASDFVLVRWHLTAATSHLLTELAWWTGERRSEITARLLLRATQHQVTAAALPGMLARDEGRAPVRLRLPRLLVVHLQDQAAGQGWSVEVLVEYLAGTYLADVLARYVAKRVHPFVDLGAVETVAVRS